MSKLQQAWYTQQKWVWILSPLALVFFALSAIRRKFFKWGWLASSNSKLPVIIVGNISVGGNGKTPLTIALVQALQNKGYKPAVLSRGYGGSQSVFPHLVNADSLAALVGDEPALMSKRLNCDVVIDPVRARGCEYIYQHTQANLIICDDGLQHYALKRDIELCVLDDRGVGNGYLLPMGPLREGTWRLNQVDACIINTRLDELPTNLAFNLPIASTKKYKMALQASAWINVSNGQRLALDDFKPISSSTYAIAGIGDPKRFFDTLTGLGIRCEKCIGFADHYAFTQHDIPSNKTVLMTEKDAVKCAGFAHADCWYLEIGADISDDFYTLIFEKLALNDKLKQTN